MFTSTTQIIYHGIICYAIESALYVRTFLCFGLFVWGMCSMGAISSFVLERICWAVGILNHILCAQRHGRYRISVEEEDGAAFDRSLQKSKYIVIVYVFNAMSYLPSQWPNIVLHCMCSVHCVARNVINIYYCLISPLKISVSLRAI